MDLTLKSTREAFGDAIVDIAHKDPNVVALTADLRDSLKLATFQENFPGRFFDMGVAEQNMVGAAAGLALDGKIPFAASFAVFNPGRNWDQIRVSVAYNNANVKIIGGYVGFSNGKDGATHQALEDIALMRVLPNMVVLDPADYDQATLAIHAAHKYVGPVYIRIRRDAVKSIESIVNSYIEKKSIGFEKLKFEDKFEIGSSQILKDGKDVTIIATGAMVEKAIVAAMILEEQNISAKVINLYSIKPIDRDTLIKSAQETKCFVTIEEHQFMAGMGSAVVEAIIQDFPIPVKIIGVNNTFGETGNQDELLQTRNLTVDNIIYNVKEVIKLKK